MSLPMTRRRTDADFANRHVKGDNGGLRITSRPMPPTNGTLCAECPLRKDSAPGFLGGYSPEMYLEIMATGASIACHMAKGFQANGGHARHCTGVAAFRAHQGHVCMAEDADGYMRFTAAHESTIVASTFPGVMAAVFATPEDFYWHHKPGQEDSK